MVPATVATRVFETVGLLAVCRGSGTFHGLPTIADSRVVMLADRLKTEKGRTKGLVKFFEHVERIFPSRSIRMKLFVRQDSSVSFIA